MNYNSNNPYIGIILYININLNTNLNMHIDFNIYMRTFTSSITTAKHYFSSYYLTIFEKTYTIQ